MIHPSRVAMQLLVRRRWPQLRSLEEGYAILLPVPGEMPFLARFALEGLRYIDTANCKQILVIPDAWGTVGEAGYRRVISQFDDPRIAMVSPQLIDYAMVRMLKLNAADTHWLSCVNGTARTHCAYAFLHDSDAFHMEQGAIERQYRECRDRELYTLGVAYRQEECLLEIDYHIPATWELMYSVAWAFRHGPFVCKPGQRMTPHGEMQFDSMIQPQYRDYPSGKIMLMDMPPKFLHFGGLTTTFRLWQQWRRKPTSRQVADQWLRLLVLALLEELIPDPDGLRALPRVEELARGLGDPTAPVTYATVESAQCYPEFRARMETLCEIPIFQGARAARLRDLLRPFDEYYEKWAPDGKSKPQFAWQGLGYQ